MPGRFRPALVGLLALGALHAAAMPGWWTAFPRQARLESPFRQESESAVFGKLVREGTLKLAQGGRLRVEYSKGMLLVADGRILVQYDPQARTAQRLNLRNAATDMPLLNVLVNPGALAAVYDARPAGADGVLLEPRKPGLPKVELEGQGGLLKRIAWTDGTGAKQVITLVSPRVPGPFEPDPFRFTAPAGTRWINP